VGNKMKARDIMTGGVLTIQDNATVDEARSMLMEEDISALPVLNQESDLVGIVTQTDFFNLNNWFQKQVEVNANFLADMKVRDVMTRQVVTLVEESTLEEVTRAMVNHGVHRVLIANEEKIMGVISTLDVLKAGLSSLE
jgi:CBS-domain-containing membrane protein